MEPMLFEQLGAEWARLLPDSAVDPEQLSEHTVQAALKASALGELTAFVREHRAELRRGLPGLIQRARADVLAGERETEDLGRVLVALGPHSAEGLAAGHYLVGHALRLRKTRGGRHFEQASLAYRDVGAHTLECLSALAAEAARMSPQEDRGLSFNGVTAAFGRLALANDDCSKRVAPRLDRFLMVLRLTRSLSEGNLPPADLTAVTQDELEMLRFAMVAVMRQPERIVPVARWIQSVRGLPADSWQEMDNLAAMLGDVCDWEPRICLLQEMVAQGDRRPDSLASLAGTLVEVGRAAEAKVLLTERVGERPGPEHIELLQYLVMFGVTTSDPDTGAWAATLNALGGELPELPAGMMPPPSQLREPVEQSVPRLLAHFEGGTLTVDPRLAEQGMEKIEAHTLAAIIVGLGPEEGARYRDDVAAKDPELFSKVLELLPPQARPRSAAEDHLADARRHLANRGYREAIEEYRKALTADPDLEHAHLGLGEAYYRLGDFHLSAAHFTESLAIRPTPQAYRFLGDTILKAQGDRRRARHCYEQALALDPDYGGARDALARLTTDSSEGPVSGR